MNIYSLWNLNNYDKVILVVPMYCGNPSSLYFTYKWRDFVSSVAHSLAYNSAQVADCAKMLLYKAPG